MEITNEMIEERDDMIYGRKPRNEERIKEINEGIRIFVTGKEKKGMSSCSVKLTDKSLTEGK